MDALQGKNCRNTLSKSERLSNFTLKNLIFAEGDQFFVFPLKVYWKVLDPNLEKIFFKNDITLVKPEIDQRVGQVGQNRMKQNPSFPFKKIPQNALFVFPAQIIPAVSKKKVPLAVKRNTVKRCIREGFRKNKHNLYKILERKNLCCLIAFVYTQGKILSCNEMEDKIVVSLQQIIKQIEQNY